jgi:hypothetical protein
MTARRAICVLFALVALTASVDAKSDCQMVYGSNWAFAFATPKAWSSLCKAERQFGVPVAIWPDGSTFADAQAVMYINVSAKSESEPDLPAFVRYSQSLFRAQAPSVKFTPLNLPAGVANSPALYYSASGDPGGNSENIAYIEGPTAYFIVVLSARTTEALRRAQTAYVQLLTSFVPMAATVQK